MDVHATITGPATPAITAPLTVAGLDRLGERGLLGIASGWAECESLPP